jgi:porin
MNILPRTFSQSSVSRRLFFTCFVTVAVLLIMAPFALAADQTYSGDFFKRSTMTGDWGGVRNDLAKKGITFDMNMTQTEQGVVDGGKSSSWEYGGRGSLTFKMDTGKMGLWPGGFLTTELEGNWGHSVNPYTGALLPVNSNQIFPVVAQDGVGLPALNFTQFLSEYFGMSVGKMETVSSGDMNEFAHGKGDSQFMNLAFNVNPTLLTTVPYSPLGASMIILPTKDPNAAVVAVSVVSSVGDANTTGFSTLNANRLTFVGEGRIRTGFFGLTGHQLVGYTYSNKEFVSLDQRLINISAQNLQKTKGSWAFFYNFDQYIIETKKGSGRGFGLFGRFGASDGNPNPAKYFFSVGLGGKGIMASRPNDQFGIGWYYMNVGNPTFSVLGKAHNLMRDENGFEVYYSYAITPWAMLSPDIQFVHPTQKNSPPVVGASVDDAIVMGIRLQINL